MKNAKSGSVIRLMNDQYFGGQVRRMNDIFVIVECTTVKYPGLNNMIDSNSHRVQIFRLDMLDHDGISIYSHLTAHGFDVSFEILS